MKKLIFYLVGISLVTFEPMTVCSQTLLPKDFLLKIVSESNDESNKKSPEKVYLQTDKPYYAVGDTIWFKAWLINAPTWLLSSRSRLLHIDIENDSNKVNKEYLFEASSGLSWGNMILNKKDYPSGTYTIHVYTNWMRNFDPDYFYYKQIYIGDECKSKLLIDAKVIINGNLNIQLLFSRDNIPFAVKPMRIQIMDGIRQISKQDLQTGVDGVLNLNLKIPQKAKILSIVSQFDGGEKEVIPILLNRPENIDLQFLPEGGSLVSGIYTKIAFKAINENGEGVDISGMITDANKQHIATFQSIHNGMGGFSILPKAGEQYTAEITLPNGTIRTYLLPTVKTSGTVLQVYNKLKNDSVEISFSATEDIIKQKENYFLIGKSRGIICYAAIINFSNGNKIHRYISKNLFPSGITHFIITTTKGQPLNERLIFIDHHDALNITFIADKGIYQTNDSVTLRLKVTDKEGNPIVGNFAMAVTDDRQIKADTESNNSMFTYLQLKSELKGYLEQPGYFLKAENSESMDNLLMTQGWISYNYQKINPIYEAETAFTINGQVSNIFGKPIRGSHVLLFSKSPIVFMDTVTNQQGQFVFNHFPRIDTPLFILNVVNKNGKNFNVSIKLDEKSPPLFNSPKQPFEMPWYVNSDSIKTNYFKNTKVRQEELENYPTGKHVLKEVIISAKKFIKGSENLNGPGNADFILDEKDLEIAGKKTWLQLFEEKVSGFKETNWFFIHDQQIVFIIDGVRMIELYPNWKFIDYLQYFKFNSAEDIKGIEISTSGKYTSNYNGRFDYPIVDRRAFIEITTRSGNPVISNTPGIYLYKPLAINYPKQFYKPKYILKDSITHAPDLRSTIDWEPNIITDKNGEATVKFFTADMPSEYTVIIEGTDMNGNFGYKTAKIVLNKAR